MRALIGLSLIVAVLAALSVAPALRRLSHQPGSHDVAPAGDSKSLFHAEGTAR